MVRPQFADLFAKCGSRAGVQFANHQQRAATATNEEKNREEEQNKSKTEAITTLVQQHAKQRSTTKSVNSYTYYSVTNARTRVPIYQHQRAILLSVCLFIPV